jgi:hypothetical protein
MKLRIIKYVHGKDRGCKEDVVWYIEHDDSIDHNKVWITCWPENGEAPYSVEGFDPRMVYYSEALANKAFEKIKKWYLTPTHITVREEEFEPWWKKYK